MEVPQPADEGEHLPPRVAELREDLERIERVQDEEPVVERLADPLRVQLEEVHPGLLGGPHHLLAKRREVEEAETPAHRVVAVAQPLRVVEQAGAALLEGDVESARPVERVRVEDVVRQRGLHRARRPGHQDDVPFRDAAPEEFVQAFDVRDDPLHCSSSTMSSSRCRIDSICFWIRSRSCGTSTTSAKAPRSTDARSAIRTRSAFRRSSGRFPRRSSWLRSMLSPASPSCSTYTARAFSNSGSRSTTASAAANSSSISLPRQ